MMSPRCYRWFSPAGSGGPTGVSCDKNHRAGETAGHGEGAGRVQQGKRRSEPN